MQKDKNKKLKYLVSSLSVFFLIAGLAASVILVQQQQEIRKEAAGHCTPGVLQCSGYKQVAKCIPAGEKCPTRNSNEVYNYPTWCEVAKECTETEKCFEGICVETTK